MVLSNTFPTLPMRYPLYLLIFPLIMKCQIYDIRIHRMFLCTKVMFTSGSVRVFTRVTGPHVILSHSKTLLRFKIVRSLCPIVIPLSIVVARNFMELSRCTSRLTTESQVIGDTDIISYNLLFICSAVSRQPVISDLYSLTVSVLVNTLVNVI